MRTESLPIVKFSIPRAAKLSKIGLRECNKSRNSLQPIHFISEHRTKDQLSPACAPCQRRTACVMRESSESVWRQY